MQTPAARRVAVRRRSEVGRLDQPGQCLDNRAVDGRDEVLDRREASLVCQPLQLAGQFAGDVLDRFRVENLDGFRQRAERGAGTAESLRHALEFTSLLDAAERRDNRIEQKQEMYAP